MATDSPEFWNEMWADIDDCGSGSDAILADQVKHLTPGRALEMGCGAGGNAVWLAKQGWQVTAVDYSEVAIERGNRLAAEEGVNVEFVMADASAYQPNGHPDLILSFYIQLFPVQRRSMLTNMSNALAPGGTLLFVSHDKSSSPSGWSQEDLQSLTTSEEVVSELPELRIEQAFVLHDTEGSHASHGHHESGEGQHHEPNDSPSSGSTIVRAIKPAS